MADETTRRNLLRGAAAASIVAAGGSLLAKPWLQTLKQPRTAVSVLNAQYDEAGLVDLLIRGLAQHPETLAGQDYLIRHDAGFFRSKARLALQDAGRIDPDSAPKLARKSQRSMW